MPATEAIDPGTPDAASANDTSSSEDTPEPSAAVSSRVTDEDTKAAASIPPGDRSALRVATSDLDVHLNQHTGEALVRARLTVRNDGAATLSRLPLQISSALQWQSARLQAGTTSSPLQMEQHLLPTDLDHTGAAREIAITLPKPLAPGQTASLDLFYGGRFAPSAERLLRMGAPTEQAAKADWDTVSDGFIGLRGAGNVLWYPVAAAPVFLGEGVAFTDAVESLRTRDAASQIRLRLTLEYTGNAPDSAFFRGERRPLLPIGTVDASTPPSSSSSSVNDAAESEHEGGIVTAEWPMQTLGLHTPSLFIANSAPASEGGPTLQIFGADAESAGSYTEAATKVEPLLNEWLGNQPHARLSILNLPQTGAAPFSEGFLLVLPMRATDASKLAPALAYPLAAAWLPPVVTAPWLHDGLPAFMRMLYLERTAGREATLTELAADGDLLARREAFATENSTPLDRCVEAACARTKATYVFEMLRTLAGENALRQAISGWLLLASGDPAKANTAALEALITQSSGKDLRWFFADWIEADRGLPELSIVTVAPRRVERAAAGNAVPAQRQSIGGPLGPEPIPLPGDPDSRQPAPTSGGNGTAPAEGSWLVAVEVANSGNAAVTVPVTVQSGTLTNTLPLRVPAHSHATIRVPFEAEPQEVSVNDGSVPEMRSNTHRKRIENLP